MTAAVETDEQGSTLSEGEVVGGRFKIIAFHARGSMGSVWRAVQEPLGRPVALKLLELSGPSDESGEESAKRFLREAEALAAVDHPNIVHLYDYGRHDESCYLAMEFVDGTTLARLLKDGPMEPSRAFRLARQVCAALHEAHKRGLVHRDLKPSNLLVTSHRDGERVKVVDFGIVKVAGAPDLTSHGTLVGTPHYMSPEQIRGRTVDRRSDVYALGSLLYKMITGQRPYEGSGVALLEAHLVQPVRPLSETAPQLALPACVEWTLRRCLEKQPEDRFRDTKQLARALNGCEMACEQPLLRDLKMRFRDGRALLPPDLQRADGGFKGPRYVPGSTPGAAPRVASPSPRSTLATDPTWIFVGIAALILIALVVLSAAAGGLWWAFA